ncbi:MAG: alkaline phosphatase family protein [Gemmataceae bacterium]
MSANLPPDPIKHVVVLALENRSFDQMLGIFQTLHAKLDGIDPASPPRTNQDERGQPFPQSPMTSVSIQPDPKHELKNVLRQIGSNNSQFVLDYSLEYPDTHPADRQHIMGYYDRGFLPALHPLAENFAICDHWFSSVPGPTWANRFFLHSGTSHGRVMMPEGVFNLNLHWYDQFTVYDRLNERGVTWKIYYHDFPQSLVLVHQMEPGNAACYHHLAQFFVDAAGDSAAFPAYSFIEPKYFWPHQNDDHPPHDTMRAQELIAQVYNAIRANDPLWNSTLLVVVYDEHGGFYDHVGPPAAVPPDGHTEEYTFDRLGVRVPALLVSPWVESTVLATRFDHTSLLKYLSDKWRLGPLGARVAQANSFATAIGTQGTPRTDTPRIVIMPHALRFATVMETAGESADAMNENQKALIAFSRYLETKIEEDPSTKVMRATAMMNGTQAQFRGAEERVQRFLDQQKAKAVMRP